MSYNSSPNTTPPEKFSDIALDLFKKSYETETFPSFTWSSYSAYPRPYLKSHNPQEPYTIPNPFKEHWFIGKTPVYNGYRVFAFKANFEKLMTIINFTNYIEHNSFWNGGDFYGEVQLYLKEYFETEVEAVEFGQKLAKEHKLSDLVWNQFPDPWEDK